MKTTIPEFNDGIDHDPDRHEIIEDCLWVEGLRIDSLEPGLFVYRHVEHETYVLACWAIEPDDGGGGGYMNELFVLGEEHPDEVSASALPSPDMVYQSLRTWRELWKDVKKAEEKKEYDRKVQAQLNKETRLDFAKALKKAAGIHREDSPEIKKIEKGEIDWHYDEKMLEQMKEGALR